MRPVGKLVMLVAAVVAMVMVTVGWAIAQARHQAAPQSRLVIDVVGGSGGGSVVLDFAHDGLTLGDRLAVVGTLLSKDQFEHVGNSYLDCWVGAKVLEQGDPYVCTNTLRFKDGTITTQGLDPHGVSDVFLAVIGTTGAYEGMTGQAEYIDANGVMTEIIITLDE